MLPIIISFPMYLQSDVYIHMLLFVNLSIISNKCIFETVVSENAEIAEIFIHVFCDLFFSLWHQDFVIIQSRI